MTVEEEGQLVKLAQKNPEYFGKIFDIYYSKVFNYCLRRLQNNELAEDVTSEIFFKSLNNLNKFRWQGAPFGAWLFKIAHNEIISYYRKGLEKTSSLDEMREVAGFDIGINFDATTDLINQQDEEKQFSDFKIINKELQSLPDLYKEPLHLKYFEKLSITEISVVLNKPEGTIKSLLSRGIEKLKNITNLQPLEKVDVVINEGLK